jgi:hypothetical protein
MNARQSSEQSISIWWITCFHNPEEPVPDRSPVVNTEFCSRRYDEIVCSSVYFQFRKITSFNLECVEIRSQKNSEVKSSFYVL